jgi:hypothetical protein
VFFSLFFSSERCRRTQFGFNVKKIPMKQLMTNKLAMTLFSSIMIGCIYEGAVIVRILINTTARIENKRYMEKFLF